MGSWENFSLHSKLMYWRYKCEKKNIFFFYSKILSSHQAQKLTFSSPLKLLVRFTSSSFLLVSATSSSPPNFDLASNTCTAVSRATWCTSCRSSTGSEHTSSMCAVYTSLARARALSPAAAAMHCQDRTHVTASKLVNARAVKWESSDELYVPRTDGSFYSLIDFINFRTDL